MSYYDNREAKVMIANALEEKGWTIFGYKADESDSMTDYWNPASWDGIATKNGYVLVIDNNNARYSGYEIKKYNYNKQTYKATARIEKLEAMMNDVASTENEKASCAALIEKEKEKQGIAPTYTIEEVYPTFQHGNPKHNNWHIEKDGQIVAKGSGAFAVNSYDWENKEVSAAEQKAQKLAKFIAKIEKVLTDSDALKSEVVKVAKIVTKPVEKEDTTINKGDILSFSYHGHFWIVNEVYTVADQVRVTYELLGSEKRGYQRKNNAKRYYQPLVRLQKEMNEGKVKVYTMQEVTEYVEKTVFTKTKRTQKASDAVQIDSNEVVTDTATEQPKAAQEVTVSNETVVEGEATLTINKDKNGIEITFNNKPSNNIIEALKENGFKWSSFGGKWWAKQTTDRLKFATMLVEAYNSIMEEEPVKEEIEAAQEVTEVAEQTEPATEATVNQYSFDVDTCYTYHDVHFKAWNYSVEDITELLNITSINYYECGEKFICTGLTLEQIAQIELINKDNGAIIFYDNKYNELTDNVKPSSNVIYHDFTYNSNDNEKQEESEPMNVNTFDDIFSKFDNIEVTAYDKVSADDLEFCKEQQNIYDLTIGAYNSLNDQLEVAAALTMAHSKKYAEINSGYIYAKRSAYDAGFSVWDLEKNIAKIKERFVQCIYLWFEQKYNITIDGQKIQSKYDTNVTYENIIDEIIEQLGGYNFNEKAEQEIKQKLRNSVAYDKVSPKGNKLTINSFLYIDTSWKKWGTEKIHYNSSGKIEQLLNAIQHYENGSTTMSEELQALCKQISYGKNDEVFGVHELNYNKVKSIKILKNGKVEIEFSSNQFATKFNREYCTSNVA